MTEVSTDVLRRPFPPLPDGPAPEISLPQALIRVAQDSAGTLDNRTITVTGFTMRDGDRSDLARVVIICCAADAQLARIRLSGPAAAGGRLSGQHLDQGGGHDPGGTERFEPALHSDDDSPERDPHRTPGTSVRLLTREPAITAFRSAGDPVVQATAAPAEREAAQVAGADQVPGRQQRFGEIAGVVGQLRSHLASSWAAATRAAAALPYSNRGAILTRKPAASGSVLGDHAPVQPLWQWAVDGCAHRDR